MFEWLLGTIQDVCNYINDENLISNVRANGVRQIIRQMSIRCLWGRGRKQRLCRGSIKMHSKPRKSWNKRTKKRLNKQTRIKLLRRVTVKREREIEIVVVAVNTEIDKQTIRQTSIQSNTQLGRQTIKINWSNDKVIKW